MRDSDTIYALSSGLPPAAIGVIRISGALADEALKSLIGKLPTPRRTHVAQVKHPSTGELLDESLCLWFPGPATATGEHLAEIHCHGGRAVVRAIESALNQIDGLRPAEPGEFTRRAFAHGRIDLAEAEGLSDLLFAETEMQRKVAVRAAGGAVSRKIENWQEELLKYSAWVEAELDFSDEDDVAPAQWDQLQKDCAALAIDFGVVLNRPRAEKLRDGIRVVLGGPPNSGKSTLLNALVERDAAIVSDIAGTTRDVIEIPVALAGVPFLFVDTAGVRNDGVEEIEQIGIDRAHQQFALADIILWLGPEGEAPDEAIAANALVEVASRSDAPDHIGKSETALTVSPMLGQGMEILVDALVAHGKKLMPDADTVAVNQRQAEHLQDARQQLIAIDNQRDYLIIGECLRLARTSLDAITGRASTEDMLDALFGKFCIGK